MAKENFVPHQGIDEQNARGNDPILRFIQRFEGYTSVINPDPGGGYTIGYGKNLVKNPLTPAQRKRLGGVPDNQLSITPDQAFELLKEDVAEVVRQIKHFYGKDAFKGLNQARQAALISLHYQAGVKKVHDDWPAMQKAVTQGDFDVAGREIWKNTDTFDPAKGKAMGGDIKRGIEMDHMMRTGEFVSTEKKFSGWSNPNTRIHEFDRAEDGVQAPQSTLNKNLSDIEEGKPAPKQLMGIASEDKRKLLLRRKKALLEQQKRLLLEQQGIIESQRLRGTEPPPSIPAAQTLTPEPSPLAKMGHALTQLPGEIRSVATGQNPEANKFFQRAKADPIAGVGEVIATVGSDILSLPMNVGKFAVEQFGLPKEVEGLTFPTGVINPLGQPKGRTDQTIADAIMTAVPIGIPGRAAQKASIAAASELARTAPAGIPRALSSPGAVQRFRPQPQIIQPPTQPAPQPGIISPNVQGPGLEFIQPRQIDPKVQALVTQQQGPMARFATENDYVSNVLKEAGIPRNEFKNVSEIHAKDPAAPDIQAHLDRIKEVAPDGNAEKFLNAFRKVESDRTGDLKTLAQITKEGVSGPGAQTWRFDLKGTPWSKEIQDAHIGEQLIQGVPRDPKVISSSLVDPKNPYGINPQDHKRLLRGYKDDYPTVPILTQKPSGLISREHVPVPPNVLAIVDMGRKMKPEGLMRAMLDDPTSPIFVRDLANLDPDAPFVIGARAKRVPTKDSASMAQALDAPLENLSQKATRPSYMARLFGATLDTLERISPKGRELARTWRNYLATVEQDVANDVNALDAHAARIWGRKSFKEGGWKVWQDAGMQKLYNMPEKEVRDLYDYIYVGGDLSKLPAVGTQVFAAKKQNLLKPRTGKQRTVSPQVREFARLFFQGDGRTFGGTKAYSGHPGVQTQTIMTTRGEVPVGNPNMHMPQPPEGFELSRILAPKRFEKFYQAAARQAEKRGETLTKQEYRRQLIAWDKARHSNMGLSEEGGGRLKKYAGINDERQFDLTLGGTASPYDVAKEIGYGHDPLRNFFRANLGARDLGERALIQKKVDQLTDDIVLELNNIKPNSGEWVRIVNSRVMQIPNEEIVDRTVSNIVTNIKAFNEATLLSPLSGVASLNQLTQVVGRAGFGASLGALGRSISKGAFDTDDIAKRSGALFTTMVNNLFRPNTFMGRFSQKILKAEGFTGIDTATRIFAAQAGDIYLQRTVKALMRDPQNKKLRDALSELQIDPRKVISQGGMTEAQRMRGVRTFSKFTAGGTGAENLPTWLQNNQNTARLIFQFKKFMFNNGAEMMRQWNKASNTQDAAVRLSRTLFTGTITGEVTRGIINTLRMRDDPFGSGSLHEPFASWGDGWGILGEGLTTGLATVQATLYLALIEGRKEALLGEMTGVTGVRIAGAVSDVAGAIGDTKKVPEAFRKNIIRNVPVVGTFISDFLEEEPERPGGIKPFPGVKPLGPRLTR